MADSKLQDLNGTVGVATLVDGDFFYVEQGVTAKFSLASIIKTYMWLSPTLGGHLTGGGFDVVKLGTLSMTEQAAANGDVAGDGQLWVKTATPNELWFTDDAGTDFQIGTLAGTETLTNKTLTTPVLTTPLLNDGDAGVTLASEDQTHGTPVATIPDLGDAADQFVMEDVAQTLTNKTLTAPIIGDINGAAMATEKGTGWAGAAAYSSSVSKVGNKVITHVFVDLAGLIVSTTESDIIGDSGAANSHAGQFILSETGLVLSGTITCLVAPTTGVADIDFTVSSDSNGVENADVDALGDPVVLLENTEAWTLGMSKAMANLPDATSDYLYLSAGVAGTPGTYGAGQFVIELIGYEA